MKKLIQQLRAHPLEGLSAIASVAAVIAALAAQQSAESLSNAAIRPHLDITQRLEPYFGLRVDNAGEGAAIIESFNIYIDGEPTSNIIEGNIYRSALVDSQISKVNAEGIENSNALITTIDKGIAIKSGAEIFIYKWTNLPNPIPEDMKKEVAKIDISEMQNKLAKIDIRIVYKSLSDKYYCVLYEGGSSAKYRRDNNKNGCKPK